MGLTPRKCVRMNTNNISQTPAGPKSRYLVFWAVTKEEPGRVDLSLTGEQRPAREKNYTHKHTDGNEDCRAAGMQSWGRGAGRWQARPVMSACFSSFISAREHVIKPNYPVRLVVFWIFFFFC